jgi:hypothetical protein
MPISYRPWAWHELSQQEQAAEWDRWRHSQPPPWVPSYNAGSAANPAAYAGAVLGVSSAILCWIPVLGIILALVSIAVCIAGLRMAQRPGVLSEGAAGTGLILAVLSLVASAILPATILGYLPATTRRGGRAPDAFLNSS